MLLLLSGRRLRPAGISFAWSEPLFARSDSSVSLAPKPLIIAEKPSAARAVAEALGGFSKAEGYLESPEYRLSWAIGHLVELKGPEEYDPALKRWSLSTLPILPERFELTVSAKTRAQFNLLARL